MSPLPRHNPLRPLALLSILSAGLFVLPASARTVTVQCGENSVTNALKTLDPQASNTIRVTGTCNEFIYISDFADLTIVGNTAGTQKGTLGNTTGGPVLWVVASRVQLKSLPIDGGGDGVMCREFSVCRFSGNTIQNTTGNGVMVDSADATFSGDVFQNNLNSALNLTAARVRVVQVTIKGTTAGPWGPGNGLDADSGSTVTAETLTVQGNQGAGISLVGNFHFVNRP